MKDLVEKAGISAQFEIASAATSTEEIGNPVYPPARRKLAGRGACQHCQKRCWMDPFVIRRVMPAILIPYCRRKNC